LNSTVTMTLDALLLTLSLPSKPVALTSTHLFSASASVTVTTVIPNSLSERRGEKIISELSFDGSIGITPLGGFVARMYTCNKEAVKKKYKLSMLRDIENYVAEKVSVQVRRRTLPFSFSSSSVVLLSCLLLHYHFRTLLSSL
jgi:hypothetical protein